MSQNISDTYRHTLECMMVRVFRRGDGFSKSTCPLNGGGIAIFYPCDLQMSSEIFNPSLQVLDLECCCPLPCLKQVSLLTAPLNAKNVATTKKAIWCSRLVMRFVAHDTRKFYSKVKTHDFLSRPTFSRTARTNVGNLCDDLHGLSEDFTWRCNGMK